MNNFSFSKDVKDGPFVQSNVSVIILQLLTMSSYYFYFHCEMVQQFLFVSIEFEFRIVLHDENTQ